MMLPFVLVLSAKTHRIVLNGQRYDIELRADETAPDRRDRLRPVDLAWRGPRSMFVATTVDVDSGVYGYRRVKVAYVSAGRLVPVPGPPTLSFSDYGAWRLAGKSTILTWDYILADDEPHNGPHRYRLSVLKVRHGRLVTVRQSTTLRKYDPGWADFPGDERPDVVRNDPLREWRLRWRWWGQTSTATILSGERKIGRNAVSVETGSGFCQAMRACSPLTTFVWDGSDLIQERR